MNQVGINQRHTHHNEKEFNQHTGNDKWFTKGINKMQAFSAGSETPQQLIPALISLYSSLLLHLSTYASHGPELPPNHLAASRAPHNCSPRSALTWEDWLQAAACSSREQAWRRALGGNNLTPAPPLPRPQHELRTGFRKREEKHRINQQRETGRQGQGKVRGRQEKKRTWGEWGRKGKREGAESLGRLKRLASRLGQSFLMLLKKNLPKQNTTA